MKGFNKVIPGLKSGIVRRLIVYILLFSIVITFIGTGLKLYLDYTHEIKSIHTAFKQIESSYKNSIINSLWVTDDELLSIQMDGILQLPDIQFIEIRKGAEVLQAVGTPQSENIIEHTIPLVYVYNGKDVDLGDMHIVASLKVVYRRIFDRILIILSMQAINIFIVSLFIFIFFYQLVGRHIISLASFAESIRFDSRDQMFQLDRKLKTKKPDELEQLVSSFNLMRKNLARDIKRREIVEKELRKSEARFQSLYDDAPDMYVSVSSHDASILQCNKTLLRKTGYSREEIIGSPIYKMYHDDCMEDVERAFLQFTKNGIVKDEELILKRKDGSKIDVSLNVNSVRDDSGNILHSISSWRDITERKQAEAAQIELSKMNKLILDTAGEGIYGLDINGNITFTNPVAAKITGWEINEILGKNQHDLVHHTKPDGTAYGKNECPIDAAFKVGKVHNVNDEVFWRKDGSSFPVEYISTPIKDEEGKLSGAVVTFKDITEGKKLELARKHLNLALEAKNKEMENYLYVASHDLRTPLVNIQGFSQRLKKQADSIKTLFADKTLEPETLHQLSSITDEDIPKTLRFVLSNIEKMDALINGLLQLSRTGTIEMNIQKIDMNALFAKILQSLDFQIKEAQCEIHINSLHECYGDAALLDQLFANIISNALKYSDSKRALEITVDAKKIHNKLVYSIRDTGKGIAQKHLDKIWDVFYRIDPRSGKTGEGIGLSLVKRIAEKHKGKVWVESEENKGSVFHIELHNSTYTEI